MASLSRKRQAFSLVELSIVLVILGLLVGGVLSGQALIHAAQLRSITEQREQIVTAMNTFKDKYFALPGDMPNATAFWGALNATYPACWLATPSGTPTCNGDNNGLIDGQEYCYPIQQMENAGLLPGIGLGGCTGTKFFQTKDGQGAWYFGNGGLTHAANSDRTFFGGDYGNFMYLATSHGAELFTTEDAWNLDTKMDDGLPSSGKILAYKGFTAPSCTTAAGGFSDGPGATYSLNVPGIQCFLYFLHVPS